MTSSAQEHCPRCGTILCDTTHGPRVCPRCELAAALGEAKEADLPFSGVFGDYDLESLIAHGGMGAVYRAHHRDTGRLVALKTLLAGRLANQEMRERFLREARLTAQLRHAHIVPVLEVGESDGLPYIVMEFVPGKNLADMVRDGPLPPQQAAVLLAKVSDAVAHAHEQGILHRDLKPANILLDAAGEPRVADFGLARLIDPEFVTELTVTGQMIGSPGYLAPERVPQEHEAKALHGDATAVASDVYSLGATLYHLLTGRPPFQGATLDAVLMQVVQTEPVNPRRLNPSVPLALEAICLKCLEKEPRRRYANAQELAADLQRFLDGKLVQARLPGLAARARRWCRRRPAVSGLGAAVVVLLSAVVAISVGAALRSHRDEARLRAQLADSLGAQARALVKSSEVGRRAGALEAIRQAALIRVNPELRGQAFAALALPDLHVVRDIALGPDAKGVALDADFSRYAVGRGVDAVEVRSLIGSNLLQRLVYGAKSDARRPQFSADGRYLSFKLDHEAGANADLEVWDLTTTQRVIFVEHAVSKDALCFHPRLPRLLVGRRDRRLTEWDVEKNIERANWSLPSLALLVSYSPDGGRAALNRHEGAFVHIEVRETTNGTVMAEARLQTAVLSLAWHPDGSQIALACDDGAVRLMTARDGSLRTVGEHNAQVAGAAFALGGEFLFTRGWDTELDVWNLRHYQREMRLTVSASTIQVSSSGRQVAVHEKDRLRIFAFSRGEECRELEIAVPVTIRKVIFSSDRRWLCVDGTKSIGLWDLQHAGPAASVTGARSWLLDFAPDSSQFFGWGHGRFFAWHLEAGAPGSAPTLRQEVVPPPLQTSSLVEPAGPVWVQGPDDLQTVRLTNVVAGARSAVSGTDVNGALSPNGSWLARRTQRSSTLDVTRLSNGEARDRIRLTNSATVRTQTFSPDSQSLAILTAKELKVLDVGTWASRVTRPAEGKVFAHLEYSPDSRLLLCVENTQTAALLDAQTLEPILPMPAWSHPMAMSPDGRWLVVRVEGRRAQLWDFVALRAKFRELGIDWEDKPLP